MRGGVFVELQSPCQRVEHLWGRMLVAALLEPHVRGADAGAQRHLRRAAAQPRGGAHLQVVNADVVGCRGRCTTHSRWISSGGW